MNKQSTNDILNNLGITELLDMQKEVLDKWWSAGDMLLLSPTGSGKTLAYLLPSLTMSKPKKDTITTLVVVPSRELALQIEEVVRSMKTGLRVCCCYGGHMVRTEVRSLNYPPDILIGTPGRILYHIVHGNIDLGSLKTIVLDEFDKSLELGFEEDMSKIISALGNEVKKILTSATRMQQLPEYIVMNNMAEIDYLSEYTEERISAFRVSTDERSKADTLYRLLCDVAGESTVVFCNYREATERVGDYLYEKGLDNVFFHGAMSQGDRERALTKFRNGTVNILVATDLAGRGINIPEIKSVIHYQLPKTHEQFIHRNGRAARMKNNGAVYAVVCTDEVVPEYIDALDNDYIPSEGSVLPDDAQWDTIFISKGRKDKISKGDIVGFICTNASISKSDIGVIEVKDYESFVAVRKEFSREVVSLVKNLKIKNQKAIIRICN